MGKDNRVREISQECRGMGFGIKKKNTLVVKLE